MDKLQTQFNRDVNTAIGQFADTLAVMPDSRRPQVEAMVAAQEFKWMVSSLLSMPATSDNFSENITEMSSDLQELKRVANRLKTTAFASMTQSLAAPPRDDIAFGKTLQQMSDSKVEKEWEKLVDQLGQMEEKPLTAQGFLSPELISFLLRLSVEIGKPAVRLVLEKYYRKKRGAPIPKGVGERLDRLLMTLCPTSTGTNAASISSTPGAQCVAEIYVTKVEINNMLALGNDWFVEVFINNKLKKRFNNPDTNEQIYLGEMLIDTLTFDGCGELHQFAVKISGYESDLFVDDANSEFVQVQGFCREGDEGSTKRLVSVEVFENNSMSNDIATVLVSLLVKWKCSSVLEGN